MSRTTLEAALATARATVATLEAALEQCLAGSAELLDVRQVRARFGIGRDSLLAAADRGEIELHRGPRQRLLVRRIELERWLTASPREPRERRASPANDLDAWEAEQARELRSVRGRP